MSFDGFSIKSPIGSFSYTQSASKMVIEIEEDYEMEQIAAAPSSSPVPSPEKVKRVIRRQQKEKELEKTGPIKERRKHKYKMMFQGDSPEKTNSDESVFLRKEKK